VTARDLLPILKGVMAAIVYAGIMWVMLRDRPQIALPVNLGLAFLIGWRFSLVFVRAQGDDA